MIFGKHINRYYLKYSWMLILGLIALLAVDYFQLEVPEFYQMIVNGLDKGMVTLDGQVYTFDMDFLLDKICLPLLSSRKDTFCWIADALRAATIGESSLEAT